MKKGLTELILVLDMSGSMYDLTDDTIGGVNSLLDEQRAGEGEVIVSTVLFNDRSVVIHDRVPIEKVEPMTRVTYRAGGCTALCDALGGAIHHIGTVHKYAREEDIPEHTVVAVVTDGMENASHAYSADEVCAMVNREKEKYGWEFLFMGANMDAVSTAANYGIDAMHAANSETSGAGTRRNFSGLSRMMSALRVDEEMRNATYGQIMADWKHDVEVGDENE